MKLSRAWENREESVKAAIYARVSTTDQNCELQLNAVREYIVRQGWENAGEYVDEGWSGAKASRPAFDKLMEDASKRRFDEVVVWKPGQVRQITAELQNSITGTTAPWCPVHRYQSEYRHRRIEPGSTILSPHPDGRGGI